MDMEMVEPVRPNSANAQPVTGTTTTTQATRPYAYVWVLGAITEDNPAYKGFLYDILISVRLLRDTLGSTDADFCIMAQLSPESTLNHRTTKTLPPEDMRLLDQLGIQLEMIPTQTKESFAQLVYEKFRVFQMTQYKRVLFLDADILPMTNLDYLFHLSDPDYVAANGTTTTTTTTTSQSQSQPLLRPNLFLATRGEPCNTGFFMVEPNLTTWKTLQHVIAEHHQRAQLLPYPHFDWADGWGHNFRTAGDSWESIHMTGQKRWRFHAGHSDQGLLYYFLKYKIQDVSIVIGNKVQNWIPAAPATSAQQQQQQQQPVLAKEMINVLKDHSPEPLTHLQTCPNNNNNNKGGKSTMAHLCLPLYRDYVHFSGGSKPWQKGPPKYVVKRGKGSAERLWFDELSQLNDEFDMGLDIPNWVEKHLPDMKESPLGYLARYTDHQTLVLAQSPSSNNNTNSTTTSTTNDTNTNATNANATNANATTTTTG
jgi:lipopolysaccharide biosynthesis glycosyltransferase